MKPIITILLIAACGILPSMARAAESEDILIGTTSVVSGTNARAGQDQLRGLQLWLEEANARDALLGRAVKLQHYDDRGEFDAATGLYQKLAADDKANLLVGPYGAEVTLAAAAVAERNDLPMIALGGVPNELWSRGYKNIVGLYAPADVYANPILEFARVHGLRRVAVLWQKSPFTREIADGAKSRSRELGLQIVFDEAYDPDVTDFSAILSRLKPKHADVLIVASHLADAIAWTRQLKDSKVSAKIMVLTGAAAPEFGKNVGSDADGIMGISQWEPLSTKTAGIAEFVRRFKVKYGYEPGHIAAAGYAAGQLLELTVKKAGSLEAARLRRALFELDATTVFGRYKVGTAGKQVGKSIYVVQWIKGERVLVLSEDVAGVKPLYPFGHWGQR